MERRGMLKSLCDSLIDCGKCPGRESVSKQYSYMCKNLSKCEILHRALEDRRKNQK